MISRRITAGGAALAALAVLFVGLTVVSSLGLRGLRLDLTHNRLYSVSSGTQRILDSMHEPVNLYLFFSDSASAQQPAVRVYGRRVREFLQEIAARSHGHVLLHVVDPQPFSEDEDRATEFGIRPIQSGGALANALYLGLAGTNGTDGRAVIDFFDPSKEPLLEYDVAKLLVELSQPKKPVIGWLSTVAMSGGFDHNTQQPREPWLVLEQAQQMFSVRNEPVTTTSIEPDVDVLVVVHPKDLSQATLYAIDQFALRGGRLMVFVDPYAESDDAGAGAGGVPISKSSSLEPLLAAWGVDFNPSEVLGDLQLGVPVNVRPGDPPVRHIGILALDSKDLAPSDVITSGLKTVTVATAGILRPKKGVDVKFEPLMQSSTQAAPFPEGKLLGLRDPGELRDGFKPTGERYTVAARVTGHVKTAFPGGPPAGVPIAAGPAPLAESARPLNLVVVSDVEMLSDFLWVRWRDFLGQRTPSPWANNGDFVWNALDNLAGNGDLISLRGRASYLRPFDVVDALRKSAEDRFRSKQRELEHQLAETEDKLEAMQPKVPGSGAGGAGAAGAAAPGLILSAEQERELQRFQKERVRIRKELRDVKLGLDQEIEALGSRVKFVNIVLAPALFAVLALVLNGWIKRRRSSAQGAPASEPSPAPAAPESGA